MEGGFVKACLIHAFFGSFGELEVNMMSYMALPLRHFFASSLADHYNIPAQLTGADNSTITNPAFELIYSSVASLLFVGTLIGGVIGGSLMDNYGRKATAIYIRSFIGILAAVLMITGKRLDSIELFAMGQITAGVCQSMRVVLLIYAAECAPDVYRGWAPLLVSAGGNVALIAIAPLCLPSTFATDEHWDLLPALALLLATLHLLIGASLPESPKHLYIGREHKRKESQLAVLYYQGSETELREVMAEYERERAVMRNYGDSATLAEALKNPGLRRALTIVMIVASVPTFSLLAIRSQYQQPLMMRFGMDQSTAMLVNMGINAATTPLAFFAPWAVEKFGRRPLFLAISALSTVELVLIAMAQAAVDLSGGQMTGGGSLWTTLVSLVGIVGLILGKASEMLGLLAMCPILVGEFCPHAARAVATQAFIIGPMPIVLAEVIAFPLFSAKYGATCLLPMLAASGLLLYLLYLYLPETRRMPVDRIFHRLSVRAPSILEQQRQGLCTTPSATKSELALEAKLERCLGAEDDNAMCNDDNVDGDEGKMGYESPRHGNTAWTATSDAADCSVDDDDSRPLLMTSTATFPDLDAYPHNDSDCNYKYGSLDGRRHHGESNGNCFSRQ